ncbi:hypothetical protein B4114_2850 [Geobacillus stearothermophilus]|uniref:Uncharacterized protein n=1 Tax=Geobacillus stearothermophilus TaxID=1422 RepID=A0A150NAX2_GEOSE|nr:hypothetical protein B4114_2850 [Geobacillus stearothermophilus]
MRALFRAAESGEPALAGQAGGGENAKNDHSISVNSRF